MKKKPEYKPFNCPDCGVEVQRRNSRHKRCDECSRKNTLEKSRKRTRKNYVSKGGYIPQDLYKCNRCDCEYQATDKRQKYCEPCKKVKKLEDEKIRKRKIREGRGSRVTGNVYPCIVCGDNFIFTGGKHVLCEKEECRKVYNNKKSDDFKKRNPESRKETHKKQWERRKNDPSYQEFAKRYRKEVQTPKIIQRRKDDPKANLDHRMSQQLRHSLKSNKGGRSWKDILGYTVQELYEHLESKFLPGMSWENISEWHIDHIYPKSKFNYDSENDPEFKVCWGLDNLQPLWAEDNLRKSDKTNYVIDS